MGGKRTPEQQRAYRERVRARPKPAIEQKRCSQCKATKMVAEFYRMSASSDGYQSKCKACQSAYEKAKYGNGKPRKPGVWRRRLRQEYGLTESEHAMMVLDQRCLCAICGKHPGTTRRVTLVVDHAHDTGAIRGLLCDNCNRAIGLLGDDVNILMSAVAYLLASTDALTEVGE